MTQDQPAGLAARAALRSKLDGTSHLEVIHEGGYCWRAHFTFNPPATGEELAALKAELQLPLPWAYEQFLLYCNGALLYHDDRHGQWGCRLYGTRELLKENARWHERYEATWIPTHLAFAEWLGDADLLALDTAQPMNEGRDCRVIDGDSGYFPREWGIAADTFSDWLDRLVVAQGAKYWQWY